MPENPAGCNQEDIAREYLAKRGLWKRGELSWKLQQHQHQLYYFLKSHKSLKTVINCSRRFGKTTIDLLDCLEEGLKNPGWQMGFIAPTVKAIRLIVRPIMKMLISDCPEEVKPVWNSQDSAYYFKNDSILRLAGTDNQNYENLRGFNLHLGKIDEAGACDDLQYILDDIITPQTLTTGGRVDILSTPPRTPAHDFYFIAQDAKSRGNYLELTLDDNTSIDERTKAMYLEEAGGKDSTTAQREYYCKFVTDTDTAVIPEFTQDKEAELVQELKRPDHFNVFSALDPGFNDYTGFVTGYYDFMHARYVVENEAWLRHGTTPEIARAIMETESIWGAHSVMLRASDTDPRIIADMATLHGIHFTPTAKDNKDAQINHVRMLIRQGKLYIHPRCVNLVRQMKTAVWNEQRTDWIKTKNDGHFDLLAALVYWVRNVNIYDNPYPDPCSDVLLDNNFVNPYRHTPKGNNAEALKVAFSLN